MGLTETAIVIQAEATEQQLIDRARAALDNSHWIVGQCASEWTQRYAKGRTDADFGKLVGLSPQQIRQYRSVWETFSDVSKTFSKLSWSHFLVALSWGDAAECLQWANDEGWSVREMQAWRKSQHENGNHISQEQEVEELADDQCTTNPVVDHKTDCASEENLTESSRDGREQPDRIERESPVTREPEADLLPDITDILSAIDKLVDKIEEHGTREQLERIAHRYEVRAFKIRKRLEGQA